MFYLSKKDQIYYLAQESVQDLTEMKHVALSNYFALENTLRTARKVHSGMKY